MRPKQTFNKTSNMIFFSNLISELEWQCMPLIPAQRKQRQADISKIFMRLTWST